MHLDISGHTRYYKRCLALLPHHYIPQDTNRITLIYFCLSALDILGTLDETFSPSEKAKHINFIYTFLVPDGSGFRGSPSLDLSPHPTPVSPSSAPDSLTHDTLHPPTSAYDPAHFPSTFFAIMSLYVLDDDLSRIPRPQILNHLSRLRRKNGSFTSHLGSQEVDVRYSYMVFAIRYLLGYDHKHGLPSRSHFDGDGPDLGLGRSEAELQKFEEEERNWVEQCRTYDGAYSQSPGLESHAGLTFCALSTLSFPLSCPCYSPEKSHKDSNSKAQAEMDETIDWLVSRQNEDGGFNGRLQKESDTCYSFWTLGSLSVLSSLPGVGIDGVSLVDSGKAMEYLESTEWNKGGEVGGFGKGVGEPPDLLHSFLGLCAVSLLLSTSTVLPAETADMQVGTKMNGARDRARVDEGQDTFKNEGRLREIDTRLCCSKRVLANIHAMRNRSRYQPIPF